jgi:hypothetical protein
MDSESLRVRSVSSGDEYVAPQSQRWGKVALAVGAACALLVVGVAAGSHFSSPQAVTSSVVAPVQLNQIAVVPPREECAKIGVNCAAQKCCKVTGYECYEVQPGMAKCMKECTPGKDGTCFHHTVPMKASKKSDISYSANTLFCWAFYTENTGSTKKSYELDLLRTQLFLGASIFGCETYRVYSDVETWLSPDKVSTVKVNDANGDFHFAKRKKTGSWINSNIFIAAWKAIKDEGVWASKDWTVKVDADAVFLPTRLRDYLGKVEVTENGIYLENCKYVSYGFFGSLEVLSHAAASTYMANLDDCKTSLNYLGREKLYGNEPWGEDLFAQRCMDLHGVDKVSAFDINTDAACAAWRPEGQKKNKKWSPDCATTQTPAIHHFKTPKAYFDCLKATQR